MIAMERGIGPLDRHRDGPARDRLRHAAAGRFGGRPRALAEAFVLQHRAHLGDVLAESQAAGLPPLFPAAQYFAALPPAGQLPAAAILPDEFGFRQLYFPPAVDVDIAFVPTDEIAALVEEALRCRRSTSRRRPPISTRPACRCWSRSTAARFQRFSQALGATTMSIGRRRRRRRQPAGASTSSRAWRPSGAS